MLDIDHAARLTQGNHWFRFCMPYCFVQIPSDRFKHVYLPLNRNYKPLGYLGREYVEYEAFVSQAIVFRSDPHHFERVWTDAGKLYLYNDSRSSRTDYFERYERLMSRALRLSGTIKEWSLVH